MHAKDDAPSPFLPIIIGTPQGTVTSSNAAFKIKVMPQRPGKTRVSITSGMASVSNALGEVSGKAGDEITVTAGEPPAKSP
jgi:hypothetical protein